jgi:hypothetical protein
MLNGLDPIIIFNFKKIPPALASIAKIPIVASIVEAIDLPAIPIYLSEKLTGIFIDSEDKNIDVSTDTDALTNGGEPQTNQRPISSTIKISMTASRDSLGVFLFSAMADLVFPKLTSKEYSITYLHGAVTIFGGLLHSFAITQNANDDRYNIVLELIKPAANKKPGVPVVPKITGAVPLEGVI